ncbi:hypothetical protein [Acinetobacter sp. ANC 5045]|uniref:hypothetical protein n=1 Tax=Acinetobacter sp. ANC 5045 TaxID=2529851 RepID=UPI00103EB149|nr:hypothetical protein [Acinetobacter sp. ANC 5045]TCB18974.1 hypothetical protein E0H79_05710 [Acinetobacter sp. ANC 5045]
MKTLIAFGVGIALGFCFKKAEQAKKPKFIIVDDRDSLGEYIFGDEGKEAFKKFYRGQNLDL